MTLGKKFATAVVCTGLLAMLVPSAAVFAAQQDIDLLKSYIGEWRGRGTLTADGNTETIVCKLDVTSSSNTKINYNGRCSVAGGAVGITGTMAFVEDKNRFEAVMASADFKGTAIGKRRTSGIDFTLRPDPSTGNQKDVAVGLTLNGDKIGVDFRVTDTASGKSTKAIIPFEKAA